MQNELKNRAGNYRIKSKDGVQKSANFGCREEYNSYRKDGRRIDAKNKYGIVHSGADEFLADPSSDPAAIFEAKEDLRLLYDALDILDPEQRNLIIAVFFQGKNVHEYGSENGVPKSTAYRKFDEALNSLREELQKNHYDGC